MSPPPLRVLRKPPPPRSATLGRMGKRIFWLFPLLISCSVVAREPADRLPASARARLERRFERAAVAFPPQRVHVRVFKEQRVLELWASDRGAGPMRLVHRYPVCAMSGRLGPKRREGDRQVPEGFYTVDRFNPWSRHVVSLGLSYPNAADRAHAGRRPGGDIFIHGGCRSIGCIAVGDDATREIYLAARSARDGGQARIPVHVFPTRMTRRNLARISRNAPQHRAFWASLRPAYVHFERTHEPLEVAIRRGSYVSER
jgi:murein L,D-transpeptidase YafK